MFILPWGGCGAGVRRNVPKLVKRVQYSDKCYNAASTTCHCTRNRKPYFDKHVFHILNVVLLIDIMYLS